MERVVVLGKKIENGQALYPKPEILQGTYKSLYKHFAETPGVWDYILPCNLPRSFEEFDELCSSGFGDQSSVCLAISKVQEPQQYLGILEFLEISPEHRSIEIGLVFSKELQRTTVATQAVYLYLRYCFDELGYWRVQWQCNALNESSKDAALRFGFKYECTFRRHFIVRGYARDSAYDSIIDQQWPAIRTEMERWLQPSNFEGGHQLTKLNLREK